MEKNDINPKIPKIPIIKRLWGLIPYIFLILIIMISASLYNQVQKKAQILKKQSESQIIEEKPPINVVTMKLEAKPIRDIINLPGITTPWVKLDILSEVRGKVVKQLIKEGSRVKKDQLLYVIDSRDYKNNYDSIKASYEASLSSLRRLKNLYYEQLATQSQLDEALAQTQSLKANMDNALLNVKRCNIRAPISGVINCRCVDYGKLINISDKVSEILQFDKIKVSVGIPESDVDAVRKIDTFMVKIDALNGKLFKGQKYFLSKTADQAARLYNLDIVINNSNFEILPDMFARVEIIKSEILNGISVPLYSVINRNKKQQVFVVENNISYLRDVKTGLQENFRIQITDGLKIGEEVIVVGQRNVTNGQKLNIIKSIKDIKELVN